jgi:hypothetical protein
MKPHMKTLALVGVAALVLVSATAASRWEGLAAKS